MSHESVLCTQLNELNARSRWYSSQGWHVPYAYIGVSSILVGTIADKMPTLLPWASLFASIFGILTLMHMCKIRKGTKRAVNCLQKVEEELKLEITAQLSPNVSHLVIIIVLGMIAYLILTYALLSGKFNLQSAKSQQVKLHRQIKAPRYVCPQDP